MAFNLAPDTPQPGFCFDNFQRNEHLMQKGLFPPAIVTTGTTIVGLTFDKGVILAADTRATQGATIYKKDSRKIFKLAPNIYCCGAGCSADLERVSELVRAQLELDWLNENHSARVSSPTQMIKRILYRFKGRLPIAVIVGGVDVTGSHLQVVYPAGSSHKLPYYALGSGGYSAMGVLESQWCSEMTEKRAIDVAQNAVKAGILNDMLSGNCIDRCVISHNIECPGSDVKLEYKTDASQPLQTRQKTDCYCLNTRDTEILAEKVEVVETYTEGVEQPQRR